MSTTLLVMIGGVIVALGLATWRAPRLTSIIVWSLTATIMLGAALILLVPAPLGELALWLALLTPLIWVGFQFWCYWDARKWRVALGLIAITLAGAAVAAVLPPPV